MQMVTFFFSAWDAICFRPRAQFSRPSSSDIPARLPEKQMTFGKPASAAKSMLFLRASRNGPWFSTRLSPSRW